MNRRGMERFGLGKCFAREKGEEQEETQGVPARGA